MLFCDLSPSVIHSFLLWIWYQGRRIKQKGKKVIKKKNQSLFGFMFQGLLAKIPQSCEDRKVVNCIRKVQQVSEGAPYDGT